MPIVLTPTGQFVDSETGNPVDLPPRRIPPIDPREGNVGFSQGATSQTRIPDNMSMGMESMTPTMRQKTGSAMSDVEKVQMLMDMGLTQDEAIEAVVIEKSMPPVMPQEFGGVNRNEALKGAATATMGMGALGGVPMGGQAPMAMPTPRPQMPMDMGQDRTMNPMDRLTPRNVPST